MFDGRPDLLTVPTSSRFASTEVANLVSVERASVALGTAAVLDAVSLGVGGGERIGVVGRNGGGKTTLLSVLSGRREVDTLVMIEQSPPSRLRSALPMGTM